MLVGSQFLDIQFLQLRKRPTHWPTLSLSIMATFDYYSYNQTPSGQAPPAPSQSLRQDQVWTPKKHPTHWRSWMSPPWALFCHWRNCRPRGDLPVWCCVASGRSSRQRVAAPLTLQMPSVSVTVVQGMLQFLPFTLGFSQWLLVCNSC